MNKKLKRYIWCIISIFIGVVFLFILFSGKFLPLRGVSDFLNGIENKTFDIRQRITSASREHNKDIILLEIDDITYEYILEKYGEWPMPRSVYADVINYIEKQKPKLIAFDLIFAKSMKSSPQDDAKLAKIFKDYNNIYTALSFDNMDPSLRTPPELGEKFSVDVYDAGQVIYSEAPNVRPLLKEIMDNTSNIGHINTDFDADGVSRQFYPFVVYKERIYPHMSLRLAQDAIGEPTRNYYIDKNYNLTFADRSYPMTNHLSLYLNWYGPSRTFEYVSMSKVLSDLYAKKSNQPKELSNKFKDKIIYIATTINSLHDLRTVSTDRMFPGGEIHATIVNNIIDGNFIHRLPFEWDFVLTLAICLFIGLTMLGIESSKINYKYLIPINSATTTAILILYYFIAIGVMQYFNLWIAVVMPTVGAIVTFTAIYIVRYFFKSKDYEYTYLLATTDGLTELYNHRYFQEKMIENIEECKKSGKKFSLILTDIDFFKKFNDHYGHQAGDAVLRQVARTLKHNVSKSDMVCRYGGEEMSVILKGADKAKALEVAQKLCDAVSGTIFKLNEELESHVTISLGVATYPEDGQTPTDLIEYSDKGLYNAKENGRNQVGKI